MRAPVALKWAREWLRNSAFSRHTDFSELTPQMIAEYIEKIVVHEADKSSGERQQQVDIYLNFIGKFDVPMPEPTAEEIAAEEKRVTTTEYIET